MKIENNLYLGDIIISYNFMDNQSTNLFMFLKERLLKHLFMDFYIF